MIITEEQGTRNEERGTRNEERGTKNKEQRTKNKEPYDYLFHPLNYQRQNYFIVYCLLYYFPIRNKHKMEWDS